MKIAIAQQNYTVGALKNNKFKIIESIYRAREAGAELVVFPEHAVSGANCYYLMNKSQFLEACEVAMVEIASHCEGIAVLLGLPVYDRNKRVSSAVLIKDRRIVKFFGKKNISCADEKIYYDSSTGCGFVNIGDNRLAVVVGEDIQTEEWFGDNTDVVVNLHADRYFRRRIETRYDHIKTASFIHKKTFVFVNHLGGQSETVYDGSSCVFRRGEGIAFLKSFEEDFVVVDTVAAPAVPIPTQNHTVNVYRAMKLGLHDYFEKNGFKKACLGLSGGVDSAVVLAVAVDVLGAENVRVLMLPSQFSSDHSVTDAVEMAENLGVEYDVIPITEAYNAVHESMKPVIGGTSFDKTEENIQARIRCTMLMALANKFGYILLNTSNKSEIAMGYTTIYGDMAGALSIIGDLYKTEVFSVARYINRRIEIIPENIIKKAPSAELKEGQKDSDVLPPYDLLDAILLRFVEENHGVEEIVNAGYEYNMVSHIAECIKENEFKRRQLCPVLQLSSRPFGTVYKLPLINKYILYPYEVVSDKE